MPVERVVEVRTRVDGRAVEVDVVVVPRGVVVPGALFVAAWALLWVLDPPCWHRSVVELVEQISTAVEVDRGDSRWRWQRS